MGFEELVGEFNPKAAGLAILGGAISIFVMKNMQTGLLLKAISFLATTVVCYFMVSFIANKG